MTLGAIRAFLSTFGGNPYIDALGEFAVVFVLSNLPFSCLVFTHFLLTPDLTFSVEGASQVIANNWKPGEVLILVSALLAPYSYLMAVYHRAGRHMPGYLMMSVILLLMYLASSYIFAYDKLGAIKNEHFVRQSAIGLYVIAVVIWYWSLVLQRRLSRPPKDDSSGRADKIAERLDEDHV